MLRATSPQHERLRRSIARLYGRHLGRRAWSRFYDARKQPRDYLRLTGTWTADCLLVAALIVTWDWWPLFA